LPTDIPEHIEVNVKNLTSLGDQIVLSDLPVPDGVVFLSDPHEVIARVDSIISGGSEEDLAPEATGLAEPEVIEKGKKEEEDV
jgi:large subunit ribosomal protein L25